MSTTTRFSTDGLPDSLRGVRFKDYMKQCFAVNLDVGVAHQSTLDVQMQAYRGGRLRFAGLRFSPHLTRFEGRSGARNGPSLLLSLLQKGSVEVSQEGRTRRIEAGEMVLMDFSRPFVIDSGEIETLSFYLAPSLLGSLDSTIKLVTAVPFDATGSSGVFQAIVAEVANQAPGLQDAQANDMADLLDLGLRSALRAHPRVMASTQDREAVHRARIRNFVLAHLSDPELSVAQIARELDLSTRRLHQLFASEEASLMHWIWSLRLERCREWLEDPRYRHLSVSGIAFSWGFSDAAHFSRAFRQAFGCPPSQARNRDGDRTLRVNRSRIA